MESKHKSATKSPNKLLGYHVEREGLVNLSGNYDYLSRAYYQSQDLESRGERVHPTCKEMLDAYVPPLFLEKAKAAGIAVPEYYISNGFFEAPAIVDPVNPFTLKGKVILKPQMVKSAAKSLTRNFTYAICCQEIPEGGKIVSFRSVLGWSSNKKFGAVSRLIWEKFNIPLAIIRTICFEDGRALLSDISPLFYEDLKARELKHLQEHIEWHS